MAYNPANNVAIVYTVIDQTKQGLASINKRLDMLNRTTKLLASSLNRVKQAAKFYITFRIFSAIYQGINALTGAIPGLLRRGDAWLQQLDKLQDATGMTAEQVSKIAFVARYVGMDVAKLGRDLSYLAKNVVENEDKFKKYGVQIRDSNGDLKSSYEIINSLRRAYAQYGRQLLTTAGAQSALSEGGREWMDFLTMSEKEYKRLIKLAEDYGFVMSQAAISGAEAWRNTQNVLQMQIDAIGANILGGVAPVLIALTAGITKSINDNMGSIVNFVQRVVVAVAGLIGGLFDIEFDWAAINKQLRALMGGLSGASDGADDLAGGMDDVASGSDRAKSAIERQIKALDKQLARLDRVEDRRKARREYQELQSDISEARRELTMLRSEALFESGMSLVEAELQRQAHAGDIIAAEKKLIEAKQKLRDFERQREIDAERRRLQRLRDNLQDRLSAITAAAAKTAGSLASMLQGPSKVKPWKGLGEGIKEDLKELLEDTRGMGRKFADDMMTIMFGEKTRGPTPFAGVFAPDTGRAGGLIKALQDVTQGVLYLAGVIKNALPDIPDTVGDFVDAVTTATRVVPDIDRITSDPFDPQVWREELEKSARTFVKGAYDFGPLGFVGNSSWFNDVANSVGDAWTKATKPSTPSAPYDPLSSARMTPWNLDAWIAGAGRGGGTGPPGFDLGPMGANTRWQADPTDEQKRMFERYLGGSSPVVRGGENQAGIMSGIWGNTRPIAEGTIGTQINAWPSAPLGTEVEGWNTSKLDTKVTGWGVGQNIGMRVEGWTVAKNIGIQMNKWGATSDKVNTKVSGWTVAKNIGTQMNRWKSKDVVDTKIVGAKQKGLINLNLNFAPKIVVKKGGVGIKLSAFQHGGVATTGDYAVVGEGGPELIQFSRPARVHSNPESKTMLRQAAASNISIQLDARATREFLSGRAVNTTTRALTGT